MCFKNPGVGRNIDLSDNSSKTREILSPNEILKHRNVYSLPETNILFVEVTKFKGTYSQDIVTTIADKAQG